MSTHLMFHRDLVLLKHDEQLRCPEYPDPCRHLLSVDTYEVEDMSSAP
jgi:hypothetical protein